MIYNKDTAKKVASNLLEIEAIKLSPEQPFTWASGWFSPIYCDNRITLSFPEIRKSLVASLVDLIKSKHPETNCIAGVATGAIAIGVLVAEALNLPFIYIRPSAKKHGRQNQIEGHLPEGSKVLVVEDLISTGMSSLKAVEALRSVDANILGMVALFSYGFELSKQNFKQEQVELSYLSDYDTLIELASERNYLNDDQKENLKKWREAPDKWNK
jgi:orotate phosphoribosyltransferase